MSLPPSLDPTAELLVPGDPFARFMEIHTALESGRESLDAKVSLRLASLCLVAAVGCAPELARSVRACATDLGRALGWVTDVDLETRIVIAAILVRRRADPSEFAEDVKRVRAMMRSLGLPWARSYESLAVLVLGRACSGPTIEALDVQRFAAIYEHIKLSQPAVIGPEHFPVVAVLAARGEAPETIASGVEASYRALIDEAELSGAPALHCAASLLHATNYEPSEAARRFEMLRAQLHKRGYGVAQSAYEQIATLCFLTQPIDDVVDGVSQGCERLRREFAWLSKEAAFTLAVGLVCVAALGQKSNFASVVDAEALLDLQPIVAL